MDANVPHFHNNTSVDYGDIEGAKSLFAELGNTLLDFMRMFGTKDDGRYADLADNSPSGWFAGISIDKAYRGLNMVKPLKAIWFNPASLSEIGLENPEGAAGEAIHIFIHEITHVKTRNEGADFTSELVNNYARLRARKMPVEFFEGTLTRIFENYWDALGAINERFHDYNTSTRAQSFKSAASLGPGRPEGTAQADDRASQVDAPRVQRDDQQGRRRDTGTRPTNRATGAVGEILSGLASQDPAFSLQYAGGERLRSATSGPAARTHPPRNTRLDQREQLDAPHDSPISFEHTWDSQQAAFITIATPGLASHGTPADEQSQATQG